MAGTGRATGYRSSIKNLGHGVTYTNIFDPRGPWHIRYLTVDLSADSTLDVALSNNAIPGFETTSSMAKRHGALAAVNGDYGRSTGRPVDTFAQDGRIVTTSLIYGRNFEWDQQETTTFIVSATGSPGFNPGGGTQWPVVVEKTRCDRPLRRSGAEVVSARAGSGEANEVASLLPGQSADIRWSGDVPHLLDTVGGNPTLIEDGQVQKQSVDGNDPFLMRHPRTGIGTTPDGRVLLVTVDGRAPGYSVGMSLREFATLFASLGANYALNIDGGGSTTIWVKGKGVLNRPSDGHERAVSSSVLILPGPDPGELPSPSPAPSLSPSPGGSVPSVSTPRLFPVRGSRLSAWRAIATDPASTGGMAAWLSTRHGELSPALRRAARVFSRSRH